MSIDDNLTLVDTRTEIVHEGNVITIVFTCRDEYMAMMLFDKMQHDLRKHGVISFAMQADEAEK